MDQDSLAKWQSYFDDNQRVTPFSRPEWLWPRESDDQNESWALQLDRGFAPLQLTTRNSTKTVRLMGADYEDIVSEPGKEVEAVTSLLTQLRSRNSQWDICDFRTLLPESVLMSVFSDGAGGLAKNSDLTPLLRGMTCAILPHHVYYNVQIPKTWAEYEAHLGKGLAYKMRAAEARRKKSFTTSFIRLATPETLDEDLAALFSLHTERWEAKGHRGHFGSEAARDGFTARCQGFLRLGQLRLYTLWLDGTAASALLTLADERRIYYHSSGFDTSHGKHHPTKVLIAQAIKDGLASGPKEFDFMKGEEDYKQDWATNHRVTSRLILAKNTPQGLSALAVLKLQSRYKEWKAKKSG